MTSADKYVKDNYQYYFNKNIYEINENDNKQTVIHLQQIIEAEKTQFKIKFIIAYKLFITDIKHINIFQNKFN